MRFLILAFALTVHPGTCRVMRPVRGSGKPQDLAFSADAWTPQSVPKTTRAQVSLYYVWTACGVQVVEADSMAVRVRSCVRPVDAASWPLAQMGSASNIQTTARLVIAIGINGFCCSSVRPIIIFCLLLKPPTPACGSASDRLAPIRFPARHHGPDNPGHLVGQSHRRELARLALQQL